MLATTMAHIRQFASILTRSLGKPAWNHVAKPPNNLALCCTAIAYPRFRSTRSNESDTVSITFVDRVGEERTVQGKCGELLLDVAHDNDIELEGLCEKTLSCTTCHLVFEPEEIAKLDLPEPNQDELHMLDFAYNLTPTSRLGCQIRVTEKFDGITLQYYKLHQMQERSKNN